MAGKCLITPHRFGVYYLWDITGGETRLKKECLLLYGTVCPSVVRVLRFTIIKKQRSIGKVSALSSPYSGRRAYHKRVPLQPGSPHLMIRKRQIQFECFIKIIEYQVLRLRIIGTSQQSGFQHR